MRNRKGVVSAIVVPIFIGLFELFSIMQRPRFTNFHTVDVLGLLAAGMCFGVALSAIIVLIRSYSRAANNDQPAGKSATSSRQ